MAATTQLEVPKAVHPAAPIDRRLLRAGSGEPLLLLHGVLGSAMMWKRVVPLLAPRHDVFALTGLGHRGGTHVEQRPTRIAHVVDDAERCLDALGFDRVHIAGNSLGGWVALELARRGRARSVCALSPAGFWEDEEPSAAPMLRSIMRRSRAARPFMPFLALFPAVRRVALQENATHGDRVTRAEMLHIIDDLLGCTVGEDLLSTPEHLAPLKATCPITIAWSGEDRVLPRATFAERVRAVVPDAQYLVLEGLGHVPMFDDPQRVADTILAAVARAKRS